jgi:hypothetical protein
MNSPDHCREIIDHAAYPLDELDNPLRQQTVAQIRAELAEDGCAVIRNFLSPIGLRRFMAEAQDRMPQAYYSDSKMCNVYLGEGDSELPDDHPRNTFMPRTNGFVTADQFGEEASAYQLYYWPPLMTFLAECLGKQQLFIYEDPVSNMIVNLGRPGQQFNWHFDTNEFTITMLLNPASSGGHFEYVPSLRSQDDECYDAVKKVLDGDRSQVKRLNLNAGDLQFFLGRFSLHQVTENTGDQDRLLLIMSFAEKPGMVGSAVRVKDLYGKTTEVHDQQDRVRADDLID